MNRPRLLSEKCSSCIFRPGNHMSLRPGRIKDMVDSSIAGGGSITCHQTLCYGEFPDYGEAMCRGFYDAVGEGTNVIWVMHRLGGFDEVPPPKKVGEPYD